jgi:hypothetical protein
MEKILILRGVSPVKREQSYPQKTATVPDFSTNPLKKLLTFIKCLLYSEFKRA